MIDRRRLSSPVLATCSNGHTRPLSRLYLGDTCRWVGTTSWPAGRAAVCYARMREHEVTDDPELHAAFAIGGPDAVWDILRERDGVNQARTREDM